MHMSAFVIILIVSLLVLANFYVGLNYNKLIREENSKVLTYLLNLKWLYALQLKGYSHFYM